MQSELRRLPSVDVLLSQKRQTMTKSAGGKRSTVVSVYFVRLPTRKELADVCANRVFGAAACFGIR